MAGSEPPAARRLGLSPDGLAFFYATALAHLLLKVLLGLRLVVDGRYGAGDPVAPPQSIRFTAVDLLVALGLALLLEGIVWPRLAKAARRGLLLAMVPFLLGEFILHSYFGAFLNFGLLEFNGAGRLDLTHYAVAGFTPWTATFLAGLLGCVLLGWRGGPALPGVLRTRPGLAWVLGAAALPVAFTTGHLGTAQARGLEVSPLGHLLTSLWSARGRAEVRAASPAEVRAFPHPVPPVVGTYDTAGPATVVRPGADVLLVLVESLPMVYTPLGGADSGLTALRDLATRGMQFDNFRTVFPATSRSFLALHCGRHPPMRQATVTRFRPDWRCPSLLDVLTRAGYRTGFFTASIFDYDNLRTSDFMRGYQVVADFPVLRDRARRGGPGSTAVEEEVVRDAALRFMLADTTRPSFTTYFMYWDHAPYELPFEDQHRLPPLTRYFRTLEYLDRSLRALLAAVAEHPALRETIVVVTADHGEGFGIRHATYNHAGDIYEEHVRVPFLMIIPGGPVGTSHRQASSVDVAPTLAALLGLPAEAGWTGQDLFGPGYRPTPTLLYGRGAVETNGLVDGQYKYIEYADRPAAELYDLAHDSLEHANLAPRDTALVARYRALLHRWLGVAEAEAWEGNSPSR